MKPIIKRLEQLEHVRRTQIAAEDTGAHELLMEELKRIGERMRASGQWPPEHQPTGEEVQRGVEEWFALRRKRCGDEP